MDISYRSYYDEVEMRAKKPRLQSADTTFDDEASSFKNPSQYKLVSMLLPPVSILCVTIFYMVGFIGSAWLTQYGITAFGYYTPVLQIGLWQACTPTGCSMIHEPTFFQYVSTSFRAVQAFEIIALISILATMVFHVLRFLAKGYIQQQCHRMAVLLQALSGVLVLLGCVACGIVNNHYNGTRSPMQYDYSMAMATFAGILYILTALAFWFIEPIPNTINIRIPVLQGLQERISHFGGHNYGETNF